MQQATTPISIPDLRAAVSGRVIGPATPTTTRPGRSSSGGIDRRPAAIVRVADADDVARRDRASPARHGVELAVRSGGHSAPATARPTAASSSTCRDLRRSTSMPASRPPGPRPASPRPRFTPAADEHGLAIGFGDTGSVGIGGITLGGGIGYLVRKHGLTIDNAARRRGRDRRRRAPRASTPSTDPTCSGRSAAAAATSAS